MKQTVFEIKLGTYSLLRCEDIFKCCQGYLSRKQNVICIHQAKLCYRRCRPMCCHTIDCFKSCHQNSQSEANILRQGRNKIGLKLPSQAAKCCLQRVSEYAPCIDLYPKITKLYCSMYLNDPIYYENPPWEKVYFRSLPFPKCMTE